MYPILRARYWSSELLEHQRQCMPICHWYWERTSKSSPNARAHLQSLNIEIWDICRQHYSIWSQWWDGIQGLNKSSLQRRNWSRNLNCPRFKNLLQYSTPRSLIGSTANTSNNFPKKNSGYMRIMDSLEALSGIRHLTMRYWKSWNHSSANEWWNSRTYSYSLGELMDRQWENLIISLLNQW